ncbi:MAG: Mur ligase family protein, partial [Bacteroidota bacterium]
MKLHFIAIGGSIMHSLAIALQEAGHEVSGSDDGIFDPARTKLEEAGLLPEEMGWFPARVTEEVDAVILGMHAFNDNPELQKAKALDIPLYSFPAYIYEHARQKQRVVIAGSYGKTTVTAMVMHVLGKLNRPFDYLVGGQVPGFRQAVRLSKEAPVILLEGDEYLASKLDPRPKFLSYKPHLLSISGISWDHMNVFPTEEGYVDQFGLLLKSLSKAAQIVYNESDTTLKQLTEAQTDTDVHYLHPFKAPAYKVNEGQFQVKIDGKYQEVSVFGEHNMT